MFHLKTYFLVFKTNIWEDSEMIREVLVFVAIWMQNPKQHYLFQKKLLLENRAEVILRNALTECLLLSHHNSNQSKAGKRKEFFPNFRIQLHLVINHMIWYRFNLKFLNFIIQNKEIAKKTCHWVCYSQVICKTIVKA